MRMLVTGGRGFIGSHVVERAVADGHDVLVMDHAPGGTLVEGATYVVIDLSQNFDTIREFLFHFSPQVVIHLAAWSDVRLSMNVPSILYRHNVQATAVLIEALITVAMHNPLHVIHASSSAAEEPIESHYGVSKRTNELQWEVFSRAMDEPVACLRFGNVYGERQHPKHGTLIPNCIERFWEHKPMEIYGDGEQTRDYIYVGDVVNAVFHAISPVLSGVHNVSTGESRSVHEVVQTIETVATAVTPCEPFTPHVHTQPQQGDKEAVTMSPGAALTMTGWSAGFPLESGIERQFTWHWNVNADGGWKYPRLPDGQRCYLDLHETKIITDYTEWKAYGGILTVHR